MAEHDEAWWRQQVAEADVAYTRITHERDDAWTDLYACRAQRDGLREKVDALEAWLRDAEEHYDRLKSFLREYEWGERGGFCVVCGQHQSEGHLPDCRMKAAVK